MWAVFLIIFILLLIVFFMEYPWAIIIFAIVIVALFKNMKAEEEKKRLEKEREEQLAKESREKRDNEINSVIEFAKKNGVDISQLIRKRNSLFSIASCNYATGLLTKPLRPKLTYGIGMSSGLRDMVNKGRMDEYYDSMESCNRRINDSKRMRMEYKAIENKIFDELSKIPDSDKYVKILKGYFDNDDKVFSVGATES